MQMQRIFEVSDNIIPTIASVYDRTEESLNQDVVILRNWIKSQPHLPEIMSDKCIQNIYILCKCSIEKAKERIDMYYTLRSLIPDLYDGINPATQNMQNVMDSVYWVTLPKLTKENYRVWFFALKNKNSINHLDPRYVYGIGLNILELRLHEDVMYGDIFINDFNGVNFNYISKQNPLFLGKIFTVYKKIFSIPLRGLIFFNSPSYIDIFLATLRAVLKPKVFERIKCSKDEKTLWDFLPKEMVPSDYGGDGLMLEELQEMQKTKFKQYQTRFDLLDKMWVSENLRPEKLKNDEVLGYYGNFKKLDVD